MRRNADHSPAVPTWAVVAMVALLGLNLRAALGSLPPLLPSITGDLHLSGTTQGLLTTAAIVSIGLAAPLGQRLATRAGSERTVFFMLLVLAAGGLLRLVATDTALLLLSSLVIGTGMGGASALMPALVAHHLPRVRGLAMGVYSTGLAVGVAVAAGAAAPSEALLDGWRPALALWGVVALVTALLWWLLTSRLTRGRVPLTSDVVVDHGLPWRSGTAWWVTLFTTASMVIGFSGLAWVAPVYVSLGVSTQRAAGYFVLFQLVQLGAMLTLPALTDHTRDRRPLLALVLGCSVAGIACLVVAPLTLVLPAMCLFGLGAGGGSTLALVLLVDVTRTQHDGARLNAMVMLVAYPVGACGPLLLGVLHDLTGSFTPGYTVILGLAVLTLGTVPVLRPGRFLTAAPVDDTAPTSATAQR